MTSRKEDRHPKEIPDVILDPSSGKRYMKGKFLGKASYLKLAPIMANVIVGLGFSLRHMLLLNN